MDHPHCLGILIPLPYESLSRPEDVILLRPLGFDPAWVVDLVLNHWEVMSGDHFLSPHDLIETVFEECVEVNYPLEKHDEMSAYVSTHLEELVQMALWMFHQLRPYLGQIPVERSDEVEYIYATPFEPDTEAMMVEIGFESDDVCDEDALE